MPRWFKVGCSLTLQLLVRGRNNGCAPTVGQFPCGSAIGIPGIVHPGVEINISPNPFSAEIHIIIQMAQSEKLRLTLRNLYGQELQVLFDGMAEAGQNLFSMSGNAMAEGVFILKAERGKGLSLQQIVCVK